MIKVYSMTAIMDLSFPGQRTTTATSCIPHDSVYMPGPRAGKSDTWLQIFQNDSKICEAEVTLTPLINKICKPCSLLDKKSREEFPRWCGIPVTHHSSWAGWGQLAHKWTDSSCSWHPCLLISKLTVNMVIYNVKRTRLLLLSSTTFHFISFISNLS